MNGMTIVQNAMRLRDAAYTGFVRGGFAGLGSGSRIMLPFRAGNPHKVWIGDNVLIGPSSWFMVPRLDADGPVIFIHDRVRMNQTSIAAVTSVVIEEAVGLARGVYIADHMHGFDEPGVPVRDQPLERIAPVRIGRGAWLGQNVVVMPGVTIGAGAVIGANSVVTRDVPARTVAAGSPARVIRELVG
ncbi:acyltransferase [Microbacterium thalassium]|uniref:Acetyltransferase-like isoleucine patch superfamily enzyme n=1 Tax=Microbacterium thalassium TaxID=362649 RepID=A0A7X0FMQ7_9MICO|nr:acyltransferase [Microbacterium thalassium]MBB6390269.1 acetyltransferase-like isoleucine patch superfamily enzyme [Microbacterium thalassium]GLK25378.1 putative lipopolysaccharide biosynthesis O-acetyl transferase WbbJ [Microbacterium thalassium]